MNVREIIAKAIELHASEFRAAMIAQAEIHDDMADIYARKPGLAAQQAKRGAESQRAACLNVYDAIAGGIDNIAGGDLDAICNILSNCVIALNAACKLLDIGPAQRTAAIVDWDEKQRAAKIWR